MFERQIEAEIRLRLIIAEHHLSFRAVEGVSQKRLNKTLKKTTCQSKRNLKRNMLILMVLVKLLKTNPFFNFYELL